MVGWFQRLGGAVLGLALLGAGAGGAKIPPPIAGGATQKDPQAGWTLRFDRLEHDFGEISDQASIEMTFPFTNTGMETVTIKRLHSYCGCTTPALEKKAYEPGESGVIRVVFDPTGRHATQIKRIMVYTDDSTQPIKTLIAKGYIRPVAYMEPNVINFGELGKDAELSKVMYVLGEREDFAITEVRPSNPDVFGAVILGSAPVDQDGVTMQRWTIRVDVRGGKRSGRYAETLEMVTNDPRRPTMSQNLILRVPSELQLGWAMIRVGALEVGDEVDEEILLRHARNEPFKIVSIESESKNLELSFEWTEPESPEDPHTVRVRGSAVKGVGSIQDRVVITTDLEDEEPMTLAFRGRVTGPAAQKTEGAPAAAEPAASGVVQIED